MMTIYMPAGRPWLLRSEARVSLLVSIPVSTFIPPNVYTSATNDVSVLILLIPVDVVTLIIPSVRILDVSQPSPAGSS